MGVPCLEIAEICWEQHETVLPVSAVGGNFGRRDHLKKNLSSSSIFELYWVLLKSTAIPSFSVEQMLPVPKNSQRHRWFCLKWWNVDSWRRRWSSTTSQIRSSFCSLDCSTSHPPGRRSPAKLAHHRSLPRRSSSPNSFSRSSRGQQHLCSRHVSYFNIFQSF